MFRLLLGRAFVELGKWGAMESIVGSAEHPTSDIPKVGEALSSSHVASWYVLRAWYRAEQGLLDYAGFDCDHVGRLAARIVSQEEKDKVLQEVEGVKDRIRRIQHSRDRRAMGDARDGRGMGDARGRRATRGR